MEQATFFYARTMFDSVSDVPYIEIGKNFIDNLNAKLILGRFKIDGVK